MTIDLEHIRSCNPIEDVVAEKYALKKSGSRFIGVEHDSLVVTPANSMYFWDSRDENGDVFDFIGRYHLPYGSSWNNRDTAQFMEVVEYLARRGGITIERGTDFRQTAEWAERQLVQRLHDEGARLEYANHPTGKTGLHAVRQTASARWLEPVGHMA